MPRTKSHAGVRSAGKKSGTLVSPSRNVATPRRPKRETDRSTGVIDLARDRPIAAAAVAAGAAAAGLFLWSRRSQISTQLNNLSNQIGEWTDNVRSDGENGTAGDDTGGLATSSGNLGSQGRRLGAARAMSKTGSRSEARGRASGSARTATSTSEQAQPVHVTQE